MPTLQDDCRTLGYQYLSVDLRYLERWHRADANNKIEDLAKRMYQHEGYVVDRTEGAVFFLLDRMLTALATPGAAQLEAKLMSLSDRRDAEDLKNREAFDRLYVRLIESGTIRTVFDYWKATPNRAIWPRQAGALLTWTFLQEVITNHRAILGDILFTRIVLYGGMGWPDLTLLKDGVMSFVEVKLKKDGFTDRQRDWANTIRKELRLQPTLLHVQE